MTQTGTPGSQRCRIVAPAIASTARTMAQKYQYSQPTVKPAHGPSALRQYSTNDPTAGFATAISPSIRITSTMSAPAARYDRTAAGPVWFITAPLPTNSPAPITPPSEIIVMWRWRRPFWSCAEPSSCVVAAIGPPPGVGCSGTGVPRAGARETGGAAPSTPTRCAGDRAWRDGGRTGRDAPRATAHARSGDRTGRPHGGRKWRLGPNGG